MTWPRLTLFESRQNDLQEADEKRATLKWEIRATNRTAGTFSASKTYFYLIFRILQLREIQCNIY